MKIRTKSYKGVKLSDLGSLFNMCKKKKLRRQLGVPSYWL